MNAKKIGAANIKYKIKPAEICIREMHKCKIYIRFGAAYFSLKNLVSAKTKCETQH